MKVLQKLFNPDEGGGFHPFWADAPFCISKGLHKTALPGRVEDLIYCGSVS